MEAIIHIITRTGIGAFSIIFTTALLCFIGLLLAVLGPWSIALFIFLVFSYMLGNVILTSMEINNNGYRE